MLYEEPNTVSISAKIAQNWLFGCESISTYGIREISSRHKIRELVAIWVVTYHGIAFMVSGNLRREIQFFSLTFPSDDEPELTLHVSKSLLHGYLLSFAPLSTHC
jgi:hypothetical protein